MPPENNMIFVFCLEPFDEDDEDGDSIDDVPDAVEGNPDWKRT